MVKRKNKQKPSALKGLPLPKNKKARIALNASINPFESARASSAKAPKFHVHNRPLSGRTVPGNQLKGAGSALQRAIENRKNGLKASMEQSKKAGKFVDRRIGESRKAEMTEEERMLARVVRERSRRSKKLDKFSLDDGGDEGLELKLTHGGRAIDESYTGKVEAGDVILSDDEDKYGGQLERADTEMHFGGGAFDREKVKQASSNPYGPAGGAQSESLGDRYRSRREELQDLIMRKKFEKAEKVKSKEMQAETFESLDDNFKELAAMLNFRDKGQERRGYFEARKAGTLSQEDKEMDEWDKEMKAYLFDRRVKATDRTKTVEEIAKEEADKLHVLETRRLARMSGDFDNDDFSDISEDEDDKRKKSKKSIKRARNPDELDSDDDEEDKNELQTKFTADGLVYVDKKGNVVKKFGEDDDADKVNPDDTPEESSEEEDSDDLGDSDDEASVESNDGLSEGEESDVEGKVLEAGAKIKGRYFTDQQVDGKGKWYKGTVRKASEDERGNTRYELEYEDGDIETDVRPENVRRQNKTSEEIESEEAKKAKLAKISTRRQKAKQKAR
jgi:nucleolar protein 14